MRIETSQCRSDFIRSAALPHIETHVCEYVDDAGDIHVAVNGESSFERYEEACERARGARMAVEAIPGPALADYHRHTAPRSTGGHMAHLWARVKHAVWRARMHTSFAREGHADPRLSVAMLEFLDEAYLKDFRIYASKRRAGGIGLEQSKKDYLRRRLGALSKIERGWVRAAIDGMTVADAFLPHALSVEDAEVAEMIAEINSDGGRYVTPSQKHELQLILSTRT